MAKSGWSGGNRSGIKTGFGSGGSRRSGNPATPRSSGSPPRSSSSIGPGGNLASSLREHVKDGQQVSVENNAHPHRGHHDATLYQREGGKFTQVDKAHVTDK